MKSAAAHTPPPPAAKRPYRLGARAEAARASAERMVEAFVGRMREGWFEEIRLEDVARDAEVSVQTLIRRFGGKEGLLEAAIERVGQEVRARRAASPGDLDATLRALVEDYEASGDLVLRVLAQEERHSALRRATDVGRAGHRAWLAEAFAPALAPLPPAERERRLDALVVVTDIYLWKLVRRDMGRPIDELFALMQRLVPAALAAPAFQPQAAGARP